MIKAIKSFRAVVSGSAYPKVFSTEDELDPASEAAMAALQLECLDEEGAAAVRDAHAPASAVEVETSEPETASKAETGAADKPKGKAKGAAPENKAKGD